ncbi:OLC1v1014351C2 [Oldenlandia corymbosa var. corymbosa]|uniref:OLC1v1014351C2 n=1 Tax=Oldenlandia corymbosa var. corymbosa TaxID=529605 RepID=A0AAV1E422_OLDCO|nr:OLC1v1014351C2 [Oldenlandia corymbosa var. corymbosa]
MAIVTGDRYLESLVKYVENNAEALIEGTLVLKLNPVGLRYVQSRLEALAELESLLSGAPVDYLRAYVSDLGDHRALEQLRRILRLLPSLKVVSVLPPPARDPTPLNLLPFGRLKVLELRGCDLSTSAARGLLELRHTLEKLICHNSTDALRHIFASRIKEIKNSPQWNRLSFVSCAYNGLLLMDDSLQLLPAVETLDLSRNKFTKLDNLRKCAKLKLLDLGFNHLRTVASFSEVSCQIVKLILRNNALTTLHGIQNLKSLEGLDVSYNMISSFSEIEILAVLPSLQNLLLQGNPICFARWYRAKVFSYFSFASNLILDEKKISSREFWKRQIIVAGRQQRPASFGFYAPAREDAEAGGNFNMKRKRTSRLVSIESEDQSMGMCSGQNSVIGDSDDQSRKHEADTDEEAEIADLMNRIENMKKERSALWLQEFKEWMSPAFESSDTGKFKWANCCANGKVNVNGDMREKYPGETSRCMSDSLYFSGDDSSTNNLESDNSFADTSMGLNACISLDHIDEVASKLLRLNNRDSLTVMGRFHRNKENLTHLTNEGQQSSESRNLQVGMTRPSTASKEVVARYSSSITPGSPPHYQKDILHRRHNLEEEFLQLSAESLSLASSDSDTSCSEDESAEFGSFMPQVDQSLIGNFSERSVDNLSAARCSDHVHYGGDQAVSPPNGMHTGGSSGNPGVKSPNSRLERKIRKRRSIRRIVSLAEEDNNDFESNGDWEICRDEIVKMCQHGDVLKSVEVGTQKATIDAFTAKESGVTASGNELQERVMAFLNSDTVNVGAPETSDRLVCCKCMLLEKSQWVEMDVAVFSSKNKLHVLLIGGKYDGSVMGIKLLHSYEIGDVIEVLVGLGLEMIRLVCQPTIFVRIFSFCILSICYYHSCYRIQCKDLPYLFVKLGVERSINLLSLLDSFDSSLTQDNCRSLEQIQVDIFAGQMFGGSTMNIFQYSMVLFWHSHLPENLWFSRSLFVLKWQLIVCIEDLKEFGNLLDEKSRSSYFVMDRFCSITNISEMVISDTHHLFFMLFVVFVV